MMNDYTAHRAMRGRYADMARQVERERLARTAIEGPGHRGLVASLVQRFVGLLRGRTNDAPQTGASIDTTPVGTGRTRAGRSGADAGRSQGRVLDVAGSDG